MSPILARRSILPESLFGRVLLIIITGLVVAHGASLLLFELERANTMQRLSASEAASHIVEWTRTPAGTERSSFEPRRRMRFLWQDVDEAGNPPAGQSSPPPEFTRELRRALTQSLGEDPVVWTSSRPVGPFDRLRQTGDAPPGRPHPQGPFERNAEHVTIALRFASGRQAIVEAPLFHPAIHVPSEAWVSVLLIFGVTTLFSIFAVRLAVSPLRVLAGAAERLSRNIAEPPLPEKGAVEIRAAAKAFNRMQDRLRRHVNSRAFAFAAMSHDIRTPLTRMRLRLESLRDPAREGLSTDLDEIEALAKSVLELTRGLSAEEPLVSVDVDALIARMATDYTALGAHFASSGHAAPIMARPVALRRALGNLVDNALKYGTDVSLEVADAKDALRIAVCDRGPGIPDAELAKVTNPFYRVESSRNRETGGTGLGLAIAKDIVEGHGGELQLENRAGGGLCAIAILPR